MSRPNTRRPTGRGRGRPLAFDADARTRYLDLVATGIPLDEAAAKVGVNRRTVNMHAQQDPGFREARDRAKTAGRTARWETVPHGEYRYIHGGCRCTTCRTAASAARAGRRATAAEQDTGAAPPAAPTHPTEPNIIPLPSRDTRPDLHLSSLAAVS